MCLFMSLTCCDEESEVYNCYCAVYLSFFITYRHVEGKEKIFSFVHMKIFIKKNLSNIHVRAQIKKSLRISGRGAYSRMLIGCFLAWTLLACVLFIGYGPHACM